MLSGCLYKKAFPVTLFTKECRIEKMILFFSVMVIFCFSLHRRVVLNRTDILYRMERITCTMINFINQKDKNGEVKNIQIELRSDCIISDLGLSRLHTTKFVARNP